MKAFSSFLFLFVLLQNVFSYNYNVKFIDVPIDHFNFVNNATFQLKYLINDSFWLSDGPIFFYTGNEGTIESFADNTGFMFDIAPKFGALVVFAEHRYYGTSMPFGNDSFSSPAHLGYLSSQQALADFVLLIDYLQKVHARSAYAGQAPVVAFGGSYGGMLATWLRLKYPASVIGAIASSAPIWQFEGLTPCENFYRVATGAFETALQQDCTTPIRASWKAIRTVGSTQEGRDWLTKEWKLCEPLKDASGIDELAEWFSNILINLVMVNYPYATSFLAPLPPFPVRNFCYKVLERPSSDDKTLLSIVGNALEIYTNYTQTTQCNKINMTAASLGEAGWDFQACTEMIMPLCSDDNDMFENKDWDFNEFSLGCAKKWGVQQTLAQLPILEYGGKDLKAASNIVFSNGLLDPWSAGGVLSNISSTVSAVIIPEGAHHLDLRGENAEDPLSVIEARQFHVDNIRIWISQYYQNTERGRNLNYVRRGNNI